MAKPGEYGGEKDNGGELGERLNPKEDWRMWEEKRIQTNRKNLRKEGHFNDREKIGGRENTRKEWESEQNEEEFGEKHNSDREGDEYREREEELVEK
ncbi:hypothetical protein Zmor_016140 [Zophobas morio]|uniref:Uncharacterized protein n=1 Tax=Zophobas morio TaxID=2755281 RepID=A0AA38MI64_9CUCU|nr:hypothetical protein Zmor_016140 [Zophobas morio]